MAYKAFFNSIGSIAETPLEKVPHLKVVAEAYVQGKSLEDIIEAYFRAIENAPDEQIWTNVDEVMDFIQMEIPAILMKFNSLPAKDVIAQLLNGASIPDFDDKEGNEVKIADVLDKIMNELGN